MKKIYNLKGIKARAEKMERHVMFLEGKMKYIKM